jgi:hypothetical protein
MCGSDRKKKGAMPRDAGTNRDVTSKDDGRNGAKFRDDGKKDDSAKKEDGRFRSVRYFRFLRAA